MAAISATDSSLGRAPGGARAGAGPRAWRQAGRRRAAGDPAEPGVSAVEPIPDAELVDATVSDLEVEAERLGISKEGRKAELLARIREARAAG